MGNSTHWYRLIKRLNSHVSVLIAIFLSTAKMLENLQLIGVQSFFIIIHLCIGPYIYVLMI